MITGSIIFFNKSFAVRPDLKICSFTVTRVCFSEYTPTGRIFFFFFFFLILKIALILTGSVVKTSALFLSQAFVNFYKKEICTNIYTVLIRLQEVIKLQNFEFSTGDVIPSKFPKYFLAGLLCIFC